MACNCFKWSHFRQHCSKEYRTGETCGMKLVMQTYEVKDKCKLCTKIDTKKRMIRKEQDRIKRWRHESGRRASIEKAEDEIQRLETEVYYLEQDKQSKMTQLY